MAMSVTVNRWNQNDAETTGQFTNVVAQADGLIVADSVHLDLRGAYTGRTLYYQPSGEFTSPQGKQIVINRTANGVWSVEIGMTHNAATVLGTATEVSNYPAALVGSSTTHTHTSAFSGNFGELKARKEVATIAHEQFQAWGRGLNALGEWHTIDDVNAGHDWLYWGGHVANYMVMHNTTLTQAQKVNWCLEAIKGAVGVTTPAQWYADGDSSTKPTGPQTWYNPFTETRTTLGSPYTIVPGSNGFGTVPTSAQLDGGGWIEKMT